MSEELKPCPFCGAKPHRQLGKVWHDSDGDVRQDTVIKCPHLCVTMTGSSNGVVERWNTRADLLPVVKPLVWEDLPKPEKGKKQARTIFGHFYSIAGFSDGTWAWYTSFKAAKSGHSGLQACGLTEQEAKDAAQTDHTAQAARLLPQIDPAALVAGAYKAMRKVMGNYHWNRYASREEGGKLHHPAVFSSHTYQDVQDLIDALTPADAQAALDAAIAKAVNEKLDEAAKAVAPMTIKIAGTPYQAGCGQIADAILAMKETE